MNKIVGFLITNDNKFPNVDVFDVGLKTIQIKSGDFYVYFWGCGNIEKNIINGSYSMSFPLHNSLLDRNVIISFLDESIIVENDWLGSIPVFYNRNACIVSTLSSLCLVDKKISAEGMLNFCEFGYSVFEQTIFEDVRFMRFFSKLIFSKGRISVEYKDDPVINSSFFKDETNSDIVIKTIRSYCSNVEAIINGDIIIPTSGGYDSRLLTYLIGDKRKIRSFTYGISKSQGQSYEVVYAKKISEIYSTEWCQVELKDFNNYIDKWFDVYGFSTHLHGMYHIEFYRKILDIVGEDGQKTLLSGIVGDAWSEAGKFKAALTIQELINLGYTHGMSLDAKYLLQSSADCGLRQEFFNVYGKSLLNDKVNSVFVIRTKLILLSYLTQIPEYFGVPVWTPFLNYEVVKNMLNMDDANRKDRRWQAELFARIGLDIENMDLKCKKSNDLDYDIALKQKFHPIDVLLMGKYFKSDRLIEINETLNNASYLSFLKNKFLMAPKVKALLKLIGVENGFMKALNDYYIVKAIEKGLQYGD